MSQAQFQIKIMNDLQVYRSISISEHQINKTSIEQYLSNFNIQEPYNIVYVDADGDQITVQCEQDYQVAKTTMVQVQNHISFLVRPSLQYFQKLQLQKQTQIEIQEQYKKQPLLYQSDRPEYSITKQKLFASSCEQKVKTFQNIKSQDNQIQISLQKMDQNKWPQINLSAHALPTQNQKEQVHQQFPQQQKTQMIQAYPVQNNNFQDSQEDFKNQEEDPFYLNKQQFLLQKDIQEQEHEQIKLKLLSEGIDSEQEPLIKPIQCMKPLKDGQKLIKKKSKSKSVKKEEYMTREQTLKLIKHQIKKALLSNKQQQKPQQIKLQVQTQSAKIQDHQKFAENCSNCHKILQVPYYINSYKNVKICAKCQKKDKSLYPLIKIRQNSQSKVLFASPSMVYQTDLSLFNLQEIPMSKCYNMFLTHMSQKMKMEMKKIMQEALASQTKEKKAKDIKKTKSKKVCTNMEEQQQVSKK